MEEKVTIGGFVRKNKGKIVKGTLIVAGLILGGMFIKKLMVGEDAMTHALEALDSAESGIIDGLEAIGDAAGDIGL